MLLIALTPVAWRRIALLIALTPGCLEKDNKVVESKDLIDTK